jgi:3'5'-cyclic nucleotide phosphodiesterase
METDALPDAVGKALGLTSQEWEKIGLGDDPAVAASDIVDETVERLTALLLIRIAAWIQPRGTYSDLSTTTICRKALMDNSSWPASLDQEVMGQLKQYVKVILAGYQDVPYHNFQHCEHVTISVNKLMDMILHRVPGETAPLTYGFRDDPLMQFALLFSALIHDVQHLGIPNRQLAMEDDELAIKYNDQSIAENQSLFIGFSELLKKDYDKLRLVVFPKSEDYRRFRAACVNLVLTTDIASPERSQIGKSKWKEAFGDPYETVERKVLKQLSTTGKGSVPATPSNRAHRRMSTQSILSELSIESPVGNARHAKDLSDDSSVSLSPDSSENEDDDDPANKRISKAPAIPQAKSGSSSDEAMEIPLKAAPSPRFRKVKGHGIPDSSRSAPGAVDNASQHNEQLSGMALKFHRRLSSAAGPTHASRRHSKITRLGLRRTMDLTGQSIEVYQFQGTRTSATGAVVSHQEGDTLLAPETIDELRESVVMETILKAADVAHNLQGFDEMAKWSNRLFLELRKAYVEGRGESPQNGWFRNQIGFLDAYLLPLARKLDDMGVFGGTKGAVFAENVEENRERWTREGMSLTAAIVMEGEKVFPEDDESTG